MPYSDEHCAGGCGGRVGLTLSPDLPFCTPCLQSRTAAHRRMQEAQTKEGTRVALRSLPGSPVGSALYGKRVKLNRHNRYKRRKLTP